MERNDALNITDAELTVEAYNGWDPLELAVVGRCFAPEYFDYITNAQVRNQLQQILYETEEDLNRLQRTIEQYGARVLRPNLPDIELFQQKKKYNQTVELPPLTPRDWQITLGKRLLRVLNLRELDDICSEFQDQVIDPHNGLRFDPNCILNGASASCIVRVGTDVFFDNSDHMTPKQSRWIAENVLGPEYRIHEAVTDGHGDAVFATLKPGVILSSKHDFHINLAQEFPGWDVHRVWDSSIWAAIEVGKFKKSMFNGYWYLSGMDPSPELTEYIDKYLTKWTGFVSETVFDVNCLVLDEHNVIFSHYNKPVFDFCRKHKIEPTICELRHSYFWDGGISCCTQDLKRRGTLQTYL